MEILWSKCQNRLESFVWYFVFDAMRIVYFILFSLEKNHLFGQFMEILWSKCQTQNHLE